MCASINETSIESIPKNSSIIDAIHEQNGESTSADAAADNTQDKECPSKPFRPKPVCKWKKYFNPLGGDFYYKNVLTGEVRGKTPDDYEFETLTEKQQEDKKTLAASISQYYGSPTSGFKIVFLEMQRLENHPLFPLSVMVVFLTVFCHKIMSI